MTFWTLVRLGRPWGGVRPRRIYRSVGGRAFPEYREQDYRWCRDAFGHELYLNPYFLIDREIIAFGAYDATLHHFLRERVAPGSVCLDVGANFGGVTVHLAKLAGPRGRVFAFEPNPLMIERLRTNAARNDPHGVVETHALALSNRAGQITLHCADAANRNHGMSSIANATAPALSKTEVVATQTLDRFVAEHQLTRLDWIKVDIQGAELLFLEGAEQTLARFAPRMLMEVSPADLASVGASACELLGRLESLGYRTFDITPRGIGRELRACDVPRDFSASNVFCEKN